MGFNASFHLAAPILKLLKIVGELGEFNIVITIFNF